jgi:hypothetical protein
MAPECNAYGRLELQCAVRSYCFQCFGLLGVKSVNKISMLNTVVKISKFSVVKKKISKIA